MRDDAPAIEWRKIAGLRDIRTHEYFGVDIQIRWDAIENKLPDLQAAVTRLKANSSGSHRARMTGVLNNFQAVWMCRFQP